MHAYLVTGKTMGAQLEFAQKLLADRKIQEVLNIVPEKQTHQIRTIRELTRTLSFTPQNPVQGRGVIIEEAQLLTTEAANAFLKTLEEPPGNTTIILTAPNREVVLETIASRATHVDLGTTVFEISEEEKSLARDIFEKLTKSGVGERLQFLDTIKNREEAIQFCIGQIFIAREKMLQTTHSNPSSSFQPQFLRLIELLSSTLNDLTANVNVKIAVGDLLLHYPNLA